ncbi:MAG: error-prone DNA polymerase [Gemmatimonadota bacterium]|nr:error-prone DNA polymerase [Gemmatimonadota bacterium]
MSPAAPTPAYAELQITSNFSFLRGASHPDEMVERAAELGYRALALTDRNTLAGVVRAHEAAQRTGLHFIPGARLDLQDGPSLLCLPTTRHGYGALSRLITTGRRRAPKGECHLTREDVAAAADPAGHVFIAVPPVTPGDDFADDLAWYRDRLAAPLHLAATHYHRGDDDRRLARLADLAETHGVPLVATGDIYQHDPSRRRLHDTLTCIREHCTIDNAGWRLEANAERHLKSPAELARLFRDHPAALANTTRIAERCRFSLAELRYEYPDEVADDGRAPRETLATLTWAGAAERYPDGIPPRVRKIIEHELALIAQLEYEPYFLTVEDIVRKARELGILCQGRGSAANSAVCYCLGVTSVDPAQIDLLFERFISTERDEVPDIDVDFEHERREEVIQYIYGKYGRDRAGLTATVITYRARSALRDVGKAMGLSEDVIGRLLSMVSWRSRPVGEERAREEGFNPSDRRLALTMKLAQELCGFPRHLSQHTGGFVISRGPLCEIVPIENAAMEDRTVIEWNKDDLEVLGLIKVDVLGLGMLSCIRKAFALLKEKYGLRYTLESVPQEDPATYGMIHRADTVGVFQIESRAQMAMLPRLKPSTFYDLVIEVAIVRPGPIQGDMVHPYLRRRQGLEPVEYPSEELRQVLEKTLGVPLFQEQVMRIAIVAAGFTPAEADQLRRAMASFRNPGTIHRFRDKFIDGMTGRGYDRDFAERCFRQIEGFGEYGFPESHAASFAHLAYVSSWLKCHYPEVFACALLNSQPMGFYAPAQIVRDARDHGVEVRPTDVNHSEWDCTLEGVGKGMRARPASGPFALRLGLRQIRGLKEEDAARLIAGRPSAAHPTDTPSPASGVPGYRSPLDLWRRLGIPSAVLTRLAAADAFSSMGLDRRQAAWAVKAIDDAGPLPLFEPPHIRPEPALPAMSAGEQVAADYRSTGLSLKHHPVALLRRRLDERGVLSAAGLEGLSDGDRTTVAGIVLTRQRPGKGIVMFVTLEDETGTANLVVFPSIYENQRRDTLTARLMLCRGKVQKVDGVIHVIAERIHSLNNWLAGLGKAGGSGDTGSFVGRGRFFH